MAETVCFDGCFGCIDAQVLEALVDFTALCYHNVYSLPWFMHFCLQPGYTLGSIQYWRHIEKSNKLLCRTFS